MAVVNFDEHIRWAQNFLCNNSQRNNHIKSTINDVIFLSLLPLSKMSFPSILRNISLHFPRKLCNVASLHGQIEHYKHGKYKNAFKMAENIPNDASSLSC